jgi:hypothetical protein
LQHERLRTLPARGGCGDASLPGARGSRGEPTPTSHKSAEPRFRQGTLFGQNRAGKASAGGACCLAPFRPYHASVGSSFVKNPKTSPEKLRIPDPTGARSGKARTFSEQGRCGLTVSPLFPRFFFLFLGVWRGGGDRLAV